ncbi:hypothetical protein [Mycolicibacterium fallax]|uniref:Uncharacterized protein n=1 Tax=Mycolicibacterium fallax TaxID=1793 RepID=A0A1X1RFJ2_MYCFA|nr:hypothetical protein [Mycolicibacterium fallax]ORV04601.1 hypothetical protein AWC04_08385 [Mycolicibacterium fallax]BBY99655.1 hypothetical protein MFAL_31220 [Mycolicibacterium fallax]
MTTDNDRPTDAQMYEGVVRAAAVIAAAMAGQMNLVNRTISYAESTGHGPALVNGMVTIAAEALVAAVAYAAEDPVEGVTTDRLLYTICETARTGAQMARDIQQLTEGTDQ